MPGGRYVNMNLRVTPEARAAWEACALEHGVTSSALAEAIGLLVISEGRPLSEAIDEARRITRERLRRREE